MTAFGVDLSDFDAGRGSVDVASMARAGIELLSHKATEGTSVRHVHYGARLNAAKAAGIRLLGAYHVLHTSNVSGQVDYLIRYADEATPWWRDFPGWFWQCDAENWGSDFPSASVVKQFCDQLASRTGRAVICYASHGQYGDSLRGLGHPLWNANYPSSRAAGMASLYPGDSGPGWAPYSGQTPIIWQYSDNATIGSQPGCDANAIRDLPALTALITGNRPAVATTGRPRTLDLKGDTVTQIKPGFRDETAGTGPETLITTPCYGQGNWVHTAGYLRLKAAGTAQVRVWAHDGLGWHNFGLTTLSRDAGCASWQLQAKTGTAGGFLVQRVKLNADAEADAQIDACVEEIPA